LELGGFWVCEAAFRKVPGVIATEVGTMGGSLKNPSYEDVCTGKSGPQRFVQVTYDRKKSPMSTCSISSGQSMYLRPS